MSDPFYTAVQDKEDDWRHWKIEGGGHTVEPWDETSREHAEIIASLMNAARGAALLEAEDPEGLRLCSPGYAENPSSPPH